MPDSEFEVVLNEICEQGCRSVYKAIDQLEQGRIPNPAAALPRDRRTELLLELKSIMRVYDRASS